MPAFAAFPAADVGVSPDVREYSVTPGVFRRNCPTCGSPLTARFDYLPGQTYVPVGILDQAADVSPDLHCHVNSALPWAPLHDDLPKSGASGRDTLREDHR